MTLIIENADSKILAVLESLKALKPELEIKKEKEPKKRLHKAMKECEQILKNPNEYPSYENAKALLEDCLK